VHGSPEVKKRFEAADIKTMTFPPNMTSILQPLDLVVNGPIKKYIKAKRTEAYVAAFRKFKSDWIKPGSDKNAVFKAPNPKLPETILLFSRYGCDYSINIHFANLMVTEISNVDICTNPKRAT